MTIADDFPATVTDNQLQAEQVCFHLDARLDATADNRSFASDGNYVDGTAALLSASDHFIEYEITPGYSVSATDFDFRFRGELVTDDPLTFDVLIDGTSLLSVDFDVQASVPPGLGWYSLDLNEEDRIDGVDLEAGETVTVRVEVTSFAGGQYAIDMIAPFVDRRYADQLTFDNTVDSNEQLSGPELFANELPIELSQTETRRDVTEANVESTWDDTSNGQYIELRIGSDSFDRTTNSETASTTGGPARSIDVTLGLSRHGTRTNDTPTEGFLGQSVDTYELFANPAAVFSNSLGTAEVDAVIPPGSITGDRVEEAGQLASDDSLLTRSVLAPFDVLTDNMEIRSSEKVGFDND